MTVYFTEEELKWIVKEPFKWHIKNGCPAKLRPDIEKKLSYLYKRKQ